MLILLAFAPAACSDIKISFEETVYTVTFYMNDGTNAVHTTATVSPPKTTKVSLPENPTRLEGYAFKEWHTEDGEKFTSETLVTKNTPVYAQWEVAVYTVTFNRNENKDGTEGTVFDTRTVTPLEATTVDSLPADPTLPHHTFEGWNTEGNGSGDAFTVDTVVTKDITVYAKWTFSPESGTAGLGFLASGGATVCRQALSQAAWCRYPPFTARTPPAHTCP